MEELLKEQITDRTEHADVYVNVRMHASLYAHTRAKFSYRKYFIVQGRKYFVIFNFVVLSDYKDILTMKISRFTVVCIAMYCACDTRPMSSFITASVMERSFFDSLHTNTAAISAISIHYRSK